MNNRLNKQQILIVGAGWAGLPLAQLLVAHGADVIATKQNVTSKLKAELEGAVSGYPGSLQLILLSEEHLFDPFNENAVTQFAAAFKNRSIIITIPPSPFIGNKGINWERDKAIRSDRSLKTEIAPTYGEMIGKIVELAERYHARSLLFLSSTSLYGATSGLIHEAIPTLPQTDNAKAILTAEACINQSLLPSTILRLGGLIGHGRHPIYHLAGREGIKSPYDAINLLHIEDLLSAIATLITQQVSGEHQDQSSRLYNVVTPLHLERKCYYQTLAQKLALPLPQFESPKPLLKRIVDGGKITHETAFIYRQLDLINASLTPLTRKEIESIEIFSQDQ